MDGVMDWAYYFSSYDMCENCGGYAAYSPPRTLCEKCTAEEAQKQVEEDEEEK